MAKKRGAVFFYSLLLSLGASLIATTSAPAAVIKVGANCPTLGIKSGQFVCTKVNNKLVWQLTKKTQQITYSLPAQVSGADGSVRLTVSSSSRLSVMSISNSLQICTVTTISIKLTGQPGVCSLTFSQPGNSIYGPAPSVKATLTVVGVNLIDFQMPGALLLSQHSFSLNGSSSSGLPLTYFSDSPQVCNVVDSTLQLISAGQCQIEASQSGNDLYPAALPVVRTIEISTDRVTSDVQDTITGFQIKPIYVVPSDGIDHSYDTNGVIDGILQAGTQYLKEELGLTFPIDSTTDGYDITFFRSSKSSDYFMNNTGSYTELMKETGLLDAPSLNRKDFVFFVDTKTIVGPSYCGEAATPGNSAVVALGVDECGKKTSFFDNYASQTWVHEVFHNLGVLHVPSSCDLMFSGQSTDGTPCPPNQRLSIDINHTMYVGANAYGQDLLKLRVWDTHTSNQNLYADCWLSTVNGVPRLDGINYALCPTGTQSIGPFSYCWSHISSVSLEESIKGIWTSLGSADYWNEPWGTRVSWKCADATYVAPWKSLTVTTPGIRHYRWVINGSAAEEFNIIWQN